MINLQRVGVFISVSIFFYTLAYPLWIGKHFVLSQFIAWLGVYLISGVCLFYFLGTKSILMYILAGHILCLVAYPFKDLFFDTIRFYAIFNNINFSY